MRLGNPEGGVRGLGCRDWQNSKQSAAETYKPENRSRKAEVGGGGILKMEVNVFKTEVNLPFPPSGRKRCRSRYPLRRTNRGGQHNAPEMCDILQNKRWGPQPSAVRMGYLAVEPGEREEGMLDRAYYRGVENRGTERGYPLKRSPWQGRIRPRGVTNRRNSRAHEKRFSCR